MLKNLNIHLLFCFVSVVDILWLSTYIFAAAYIDAEDALQPNLIIVSAPVSLITAAVVWEFLFSADFLLFQTFNVLNFQLFLFSAHILYFAFHSNLTLFVLFLSNFLSLLF